MKKFLLFVFTINLSFAASNPIIFVHGQKGGKDAKPKKCWPDWNGADHGKPYRTAMDKILAEHYGGYTAGSPLDCHVNTELTPTGGETRKIYNFSYYNPDGSRGAIGSNGDILPEGCKVWKTTYIESSKSDDLWIPPGLYDEPSCMGCCLFSFGAGLVGYEIYKSLKDTTKKDYYPRFGIGISYSPGIAYTGLLSRHLGTGELDPFCNLYWNNRADICILYFLTSNWAVGIGGGYMWTELWNRTPRFTLYYPPKWEPWILDSEDSYWILSSVTGIIKVKYLLSKGKMGYLEGGLEYYYLKGESHGEFYQGYPAIFFTGESFSWARGFGGFLGLGIYKSILWNIELDISIVGRYGMAKEYKYEIPEGTEPELAGWPRFLIFIFLEFI